MVFLFFAFGILWALQRSVKKLLSNWHGSFMGQKPSKSVGDGSIVLDVVLLEIVRQHDLQGGGKLKKKVISGLFVSIVSRFLSFS